MIAVLDICTYETLYMHICINTLRCPSNNIDQEMQYRYVQGMMIQGISSDFAVELDDGGF